MPLPILANIRKLKISDFEDVRQSLLGRVFHVTRHSYLASIAAHGALVPNTTGVKSPLGNNANGYFRLKGCVSFFDYRRHESNEWKQFYQNCIPTRAMSHDDPAIVMFLSQEHYAQLIPWTQWKIDGLLEQRVVPHVEVGIEGEVGLHMISAIEIWEDANPERSRELERILNPNRIGL